ncbi:ATP-dependent DNA ligase [Candidatus Thorarchaeota archaeon]|nr:MAG: ATP-dependent DNA ligase [Candidatus Thorarchaeota archaeon]
MLYRYLADAYDAIESVSSSLEKIDIFSKLLTEATADEIEKIIPLTIGKLHPDWQGLPEIGIAEKMAIQVIAQAASSTESAVKDRLRRIGDIGSVAEELLESGSQTTLAPEELTVTGVYVTLDEIAEESGTGSARVKMSRLIGLLSDAEPLEARYILRTITGSLRLGLSEMGILDSLALAFTGTRETRPDIERAFNMCSDLARVAKLLHSEDLTAIRELGPQVGTPIRMMAAKKLTTAEEILEKAGGKALVEVKYDGERIQAHRKGNRIVLFSRRQEEITHQYPDVVQYITEGITADSCIIEGECIAIDPHTGKTRPFQELMRRRRKTDIREISEEIPVAFRAFDLLLLNGDDLTSKPILTRRNHLESITVSNENISLTEGEVTDDFKRLQELFENSLKSGNEGVIAKAVHDDAVYQAGSRSWLWIKLKPSYTDTFTDSVDLVVVGALHGRGKRTGVYGTIVASAYDEEHDTFPTVCKIGTGFTDEMLAEFKERLDVLRLESPSPKVLADIQADIWFEPKEVIEVIGDEMTLSPIHLAGKDRLREGGLAIRFPRFTGRWRDDKSPTQATTVGELIELFQSQHARKGHE